MKPITIAAAILCAACGLAWIVMDVLTTIQDSIGTVLQ